MNSHPPKNQDGIVTLSSRITMDDRVIMESTGSVWTKPTQSSRRCAHAGGIANPLKTEPITSARIKNDEIDGGYSRILSCHAKFQRLKVHANRTNAVELGSEAFGYSSLTSGVWLTASEPRDRPRLQSLEKARFRALQDATYNEPYNQCNTEDRHSSGRNHVD